MERGKGHVKIFLHISSKRLMKLVKTRIFYCLFYFYLPHIQTRKTPNNTQIGGEREQKRAVTNF